MKYKSCKTEDYDQPTYCNSEMDCHKIYPHWNSDMENEYHSCTDMAEDDCCMPKIKCKPTKECIQTYKCYYKLYKISRYHLYKVCPRCGHEFDYYRNRGICPKCM